jgi:hypothetical protein
MIVFMHLMMYVVAYGAMLVLLASILWLAGWLAITCIGRIALRADHAPDRVVDDAVAEFIPGERLRHVGEERAAPVPAQSASRRS